MSIFTDFIAFKSSLFNSNRKNSRFGNNKLNIQSQYKKIGSVDQRALAQCNVCHAKFERGGGGEGCVTHLK